MQETNNRIYGSIPVPPAQTKRMVEHISPRNISANAVEMLIDFASKVTVESISGVHQNLPW